MQDYNSKYGGAALDAQLDKVDVVDAKLTELESNFSIEKPIELVYIGHNYIAYNGALLEYDSYECYKIDVSDINKIKIETFVPTQTTGTRKYAFYQSEEISSSTAIKVGEVLQAPYAEVLDVPSGSKFLLVVNLVGCQRPNVAEVEVGNLSNLSSDLSNLSSDLSNLSSDLSNLSSDVGKINNLLVSEIQANAINSISGKYIAYNGDLLTYTVYESFVYDVSALDKVRIFSNINQSTGSYRYAFYSVSDTAEIKSTTAVRVGNLLDGAYDIIENVPADAKSLVVVGYNGMNPSVYYYKPEPIKVKSTNRIYAIRNDDSIIGISKYGVDEDIAIEWRKKGNNNIFDLWKIYKKKNASFIPSSNLENATTMIVSNTDWTGPYQVAALENINGDQPDSYETTGGNHDYSGGSGTGTATGRTESVKMFIDGQEKIGNYEGYCSELKIVWTNYIQAYNTAKEDGSGREVLKETQIATFDGITWHRQAHIHILEDVRLLNYYGMQCVFLDYWNKGVVFVGGNNRKINEGIKSSNSGNREATELICFGEEDEMVMGLDATYDIGDRRFYASDGTKSLMVNGSTSKGYTYLVSSKTQGGYTYFTFAKDDILSYRGYYIFRPRTIL